MLNQALQQRAVELEEAKNEAEQAGAGDTSLDSMSTDDLVEKMAAAPLYAALGRGGKYILGTGVLDRIRNSSNFADIKNRLFRTKLLITGGAYKDWPEFFWGVFDF